MRSSRGQQLLVVAGCVLLLTAIASPARAQKLRPTNGANSFGPAFCADASQPGSTDQVILLEYTAEQKWSSVTTAPTEQIFAVNGQCPTVPSNATSLDPPSGSIVLLTNQQIPDFTAHNTNLRVSQLAIPDCATVQTTQWNVCFYEFYTPTSLYTTATPTSSFSSLTLTYDSQPPGAPELTAVESGDQHLRVTFTQPSDDDLGSYEVLIAPGPASTGTGAATGSPQASPRATAASGSTGTTATTGSTAATATTGATTTTGPTTTTGATTATYGSTGATTTTGSGSSSTGSTGSTTTTSATTGGTTGFAAFACRSDATVAATFGAGVLSGVVPGDQQKPLVNGTTYTVQVRALDKTDNRGPCSAEVTGTPQLIDDFWRLYKKNGGSDPGGCGQTGAGFAFLGLCGAVALLALRRRKD